MKKIYLVRHAKSSWKEEGMDDFLRPLNSRGKRDLITIGKRLLKHKANPDLIYASPSVRTTKTAKELAHTINHDKKKILFIDSLYESTFEKYLELIHKTDDTNETIFIVGHNPTITEVGERLSGAILDNLPTCAIFGMAFDVEHFSEIEEENGEVLFYDYPKKEI